MKEKQRKTKKTEKIKYKKMACSAYYAIVQPPSGTDPDVYMRDATSKDGPLCSAQYLNSACKNNCLQMTKNYGGCFS